ncbi:hypothetical protein FVE85_4653 [Porphyridium purpureum]|uniref:Uncharacterized protein n=1 Tax=Porphyridium purpureum TaxID=35688 RepID=A0A5J4YQG8_PORPP|nr:hypothetical protein FVE85_4653 [Porphyridium purpureum]|eukprot:POR5817..scf236_6
MPDQRQLDIRSVLCFQRKHLRVQPLEEPAEHLSRLELALPVRRQQEAFCVSHPIESRHAHDLGRNAVLIFQYLLQGNVICCTISKTGHNHTWSEFASCRILRSSRLVGRTNWTDPAHSRTLTKAALSPFTSRSNTSRVACRATRPQPSDRYVRKHRPSTTSRQVREMGDLGSKLDVLLRTSAEGAASLGFVFMGMIGQDG